MARPLADKTCYTHEEFVHILGGDNGCIGSGVVSGFPETKPEACFKGYGQNEVFLERRRNSIFAKDGCVFFLDTRYASPLSILFGLGRPDVKKRVYSSFRFDDSVVQRARPHSSLADISRGGLRRTIWKELVRGRHIWGRRGRIICIPPPPLPRNVLVCVLNYPWACGIIMSTACHGEEGGISARTSASRSRMCGCVVRREPS